MEQKMITAAEARQITDREIGIEAIMKKILTTSLKGLSRIEVPIPPQKDIDTLESLDYKFWMTEKQDKLIIAW